MIAAGAVAFVVIGLSDGCNAHKRPPGLSPEERALLEHTPLPSSVTVVWRHEEDGQQVLC